MNNPTDFDLHAEALRDGYYALTHNEGFHGPHWLNINAMQMYGTHRLPDENNFHPVTYYAASGALGMDILRHETQDFILKNMQISKSTFSKYLKKGRIRVVGRDVAEYTLMRKDCRDTYVFLNNEQMADEFGSDAPDEIRYAFQTGHTFRGWDVTMRYVEVDAEWKVIKQL